MMAGEALLFLVVLVGGVGGAFVLLSLIWAEDDPGEPTDWETGRRRARRDTRDARDDERRR